MIEVLVIYENELGAQFEEVIEVDEDNIQEEIDDFVKYLRRNGYFLIDYYKI